MSSAYKIALSTTKKAQEHQKDGYDLKTRGCIVEVAGMFILFLFGKWPTGKSKFRCSVLFLPVPFSRLTTKTGISKFGCLSTTYGLSSQ
jgi:hypothetical protein